MSNSSKASCGWANSLRPVCALLSRQLGNRSSQCHSVPESTFCSRHRVFSRQQEVSHRWLSVTHRCWLDSVLGPGIIAYSNHQWDVKEFQSRIKNKASILLLFFRFPWSFKSINSLFVFLTFIVKLNLDQIALDPDLLTFHLSLWYY